MVASCPRFFLSRSPQRFLTDIAVLQQAAPHLKIKMSTSSEASPVNGRSSLAIDDHDEHMANGDQSDSDLSDVQPVDVDGPSSDPVVAARAPAQLPAVTLEDPSESSDNDASDDADFDMADSPASAQSNEDAVGNAARDSRPPPKRKATQTIEDDFMRENPELYGLRRSVGN